MFKKEDGIIYMDDNVLPDEDSTALVSISNDLILNAKFPKLSASSIQLLLFLLTTVKKEDVDFKTYRLSIKNYQKLMGVTKRKDLYKKFDLATEELMTKLIKSHNPELNSFDKVAWCSGAKYRGSEGYIDLRFDPALKPFLLFLQGNFTQYELRAATFLKSTSFWTYNLIKCYQGKREQRFGKSGSQVIDLDHYKEYIGLDVNNDYKNNFGGFKVRVLKKVQKDLQKYTDLTIDWDTIKTGRKITGLRFKWSPNPSFEQLPLALPTEPEQVDLQSIEKKNLTFAEQKLKEFGFYDFKKMAGWLPVQEDWEVIFEDLDLEIKRRKKTKNPISEEQCGGWLRTQLKRSGKGKSYKPTEKYKQNKIRDGVIKQNEEKRRKFEIEEGKKIAQNNAQKEEHAKIKKIIAQLPKKEQDKLHKKAEKMMDDEGKRSSLASMNRMTIMFNKIKIYKEISK